MQVKFCFDRVDEHSLKVLDEPIVCMISFIYKSGMTDGSGMNHRKCRGAIALDADRLGALRISVRLFI